MKYWEETERACAIRARVHALLDELGVAPTPVNYELWFHYELSQNLDLRRALDAAVKNGTANDLARAREIHTRFFIQCDDRVDQAGATIRKELVQLVSALTTAGEGAAAYGKALDTTGADLKQVGALSELNRVVETAALATSQMEERNRVLEAQVQASSRELETLRAKMDAIRQESRVDALTQLANRRAFDERIESAIKDASTERKSLCVLMCDIDRFKIFNDTWGHTTGDQVIRLVASLVKSNVKGKDLAARYGGEEIVVLLPQTSLSNAVTIAEQIRASIESKEVVKKSSGELLGQVTVSIGVAQYLSGESSEMLIGRADSHLYAAKQRGRNQVSWIRHADHTGDQRLQSGAPPPTQTVGNSLSAVSKSSPALELEFVDQDTPLIVDAEVKLSDRRLMRLHEWWCAARTNAASPIWHDYFLSQIDFIKDYAHVHSLQKTGQQIIVRFAGAAIIQALGADPTGHLYSATEASLSDLQSTANRTFELVKLTKAMNAPCVPIQKAFAI